MGGMFYDNFEVYFAVLNLAKIVMGLEIFGNFKAMVSNIVKKLHVK